MGSHRIWSIGVGRWGGLQIRIHSLFLLFALITLFLGWQASIHDESPDALKVAGGSLCILLISVFLHDLGHYLAALRLGGDGSEIVLGPLGGLASMRPPLEPLSEAAMHIAGPAVNLGVCALTGAVTVAAGEDLLGMLNPLNPRNLIDPDRAWLVACKLTFWINWVVFVANLLPAFPFDGGRALRAALLSLSPDSGARRASLFVATIAKITALALAVAAVLLYVRNGSQAHPVPAWFALSLLAIFLYFSAKQESERHHDIEEQQEPFGYDFSQGYTSLERAQERDEEQPVGPVQRWLAQRKQARLDRQREIEAEEESRVDDILSRLHAHGIDSLSREDRSLLDRVSARYRYRNSD